MIHWANLIRKKTITLKRKLLLTSSFSLLITIGLLCVVCYGLLSYTARKDRIQADDNIADQICENLGNTVNTINSSMRNIIYSSTLQQLLEQYTFGNGGKEMDRFDFQNQINLALKSQITNLSFFTSISLYDNDGDLLVGLGDSLGSSHIQSYPWFEELEKSQGESIWLTDYMKQGRGNEAPVIPVAQRVRSVHITPHFGDDVGYVLVDVNLQWIWESILLLNYETSNQIYALDQEGKIFIGDAPEPWKKQFPFETAESFGGSEKTDRYGNRFLVTVKAIPHTEWKIACLSEYLDVMREVHLAVLVCILIAALLFVVFLFVSAYNARSILRPIQRLQSAFRHAEVGNFDKQLLLDTEVVELNDLNAGFNRMIERLVSLLQNVYASELKEQQMIAEVQRSQIEALQMQINPHFIYNTLDSINWMAMAAGNDDVSAMVLALGEVLRFNVSIQQLHTTLEKEIKNTEQFLYIQHVRFQPRLRYRIQVPDALLNRKVLKLLLQPLVENAVRHGMGPSVQVMHIQIQIWEENTADGATLCFKCSDDGAGMPPEMLEELRGVWNNIISGREVKDKVGLVNLMRRLYLCDGKAVDFSVESVLGKGTCVRICVPSRTF